MAEPCCAGVPKLDDANDAGTKRSDDCTLILTEGDSAKTLAVAGLSIIGRDKYGVFPLRGKMLNVREATHKQVIYTFPLNVPHSLHLSNNPTLLSPYISHFHYPLSLNLSHHSPSPYISHFPSP